MNGVSRGMGAIPAEVGTEAELGCPRCNSPDHHANPNECIQALQRVVQTLKYDLEHDTLSGLERRKMLEEWARRRIENDDEYTNFALVVLDLDNFKRVNDLEGHDAGDSLIRIASEVLHDNVRENSGDIVVRLYRGDEFAVGIDSAFRAERTAHRIWNALDTAMKEYGSGCSSGVATFPRDGRTFEGLMRIADARMQACKRARKAGR